MFLCFFLSSSCASLPPTLFSQFLVFLRTSEALWSVPLTRCRRPGTRLPGQRPTSPHWRAREVSLLPAVQLTRLASSPTCGVLRRICSAWWPWTTGVTAPRVRWSQPKPVNVLILKIWAFYFGHMKAYWKMVRQLLKGRTIGSLCFSHQWISWNHQNHQWTDPVNKYFQCNQIFLIHLFQSTYFSSVCPGFALFMEFVGSLLKYKRMPFS